jgi:pimeloyl-ACP methyl ester carboxylesterase
MLRLWLLTTLVATVASGFQHRRMQELVEGAGFPLEEHFVETNDGYVLGVYRIPHGRQRQRRGLPPGGGPPAGVVLLQHGLLDSSATWVLNRPDQSLGFLLADAGFDVWMSNSRGNAFSRNHTGFLPTSPAFWEFSFAEMAAYDLPAAVAYILQHTGAATLSYVGHSQGCTQAFAALSADAALRRQLDVFVALAPAVYLRRVSSLPMLFLARLEIDQLAALVGAREFLPSRRAASDVFGALCSAAPPACQSVLTLLCGYNEDNLNLTRLPTYLAYAPSGTSVKNMEHWAQLVRQSRAGPPSFRRYDYGACATPAAAPRTCNRNVYGADTPPEYDLGAIRGVPVALFDGVADRLADPIDVESLAEALPPGAVVFRNTQPTFEHLDFTWGLSAAELIYPHVLDLLFKYSGGHGGGGGGAAAA